MSRPASSALARQIRRFSYSGVVNSLAGYSVIFLGIVLGFSPYLSNLAGYAVGLSISFLLSRNYVFSGSGGIYSQTFRFLIAFGIAYLANLAMLHACLRSGFGMLASQVTAGIVYLIAMFVLSRTWVFRSETTESS